MNYVMNQSLLKFYLNSCQGYATNPDYVYRILVERVANEEISVKYWVVLLFTLSALTKDIELYSAYLYSESDKWIEQNNRVVLVPCPVL